MTEKKKKASNSSMRLDKFLVEMGKGTRSQIKEMAKKGRIQINGIVIKATDEKIDPEKDAVLLDGQPVSYAHTEYFMLNKPAGTVSATEDGKYPTVISLIGSALRKDLFPVGRLDLDTEGLLLITNDGAMAHELLSPKKHVDKIYLAYIEGTLPKDAKKQMKEGLVIEEGVKTLPAELVILPPQEGMKEGLTAVSLRIHEGKFHQVKRMFEVLGCKVVYLKRVTMGPLVLDPSLKPGEYRGLKEKELKALERKMNEKDRTHILDGVSAVLFDLDGTLVDSMWMWEAIDIEYLGRYGLTCPPDLQKSIEGMSFSETAVYFKERFNLPDSIDEIKQAWVEMSLEKYQKEVPVKPGVREFLEEITIRGIKAGIATSNGREMVDAVLKSLGLEKYFQVVATACEVTAGKPAPDIYLEVARRLQAEPSRCMVFEDVPAGIQAGKRAGMRVCAVEDAFSTGMRQEKMELADFYIDDYNELFDAE